MSVTISAQGLRFQRFQCRVSCSRCVQIRDFNAWVRRCGLCGAHAVAHLPWCQAPLRCRVHIRLRGVRRQRVCRLQATFRSGCSRRSWKLHRAERAMYSSVVDCVIRYVDDPWGLASLRPKELDQILMGNLLLGFALECMMLLALCGGAGVLEHPKEPEPEHMVSSWRLLIVQLLLLLPHELRTRPSRRSESQTYGPTGPWSSWARRTWEPVESPLACLRVFLWERVRPVSTRPRRSRSTRRPCIEHCSLLILQRSHLAMHRSWSFLAWILPPSCTADERQGVRDAHWPWRLIWLSLPSRSVRLINGPKGEECTICCWIVVVYHDVLSKTTCHMLLPSSSFPVHEEVKRRYFPRKKDEAKERRCCFCLGGGTVAPDRRENE